MNAPQLVGNPRRPQSARHAAQCILLLLLAAVLGWPTRCGAAEPGLAEKLDPLIAAHRGRVAVAIKHLEGGEEYLRDADAVMPTASLIKVAVMAAAYRLVDQGELDLDRKLTLRAEDKVPGSGILTPHLSPGATFTLRDAIRLMIAFSDNTATNLVLGAIGLPTTADTMESLGYPNTKIHGLVFRRDSSIFPERSKQYGLGSTTPREMVQLLEALHRRRVASPASCDAMLAHLAACENDDMLARDLPSSVRLAHKTGSVDAVRTDAGILTTPAGTIVICVMTADNRDQSWTRENAAEILGAKIARLACDHFIKSQPAAAEEGLARLALGSSGPMVEALQRTLNVRLEPSPELSVDGDFGSMTAAAVRRFQSEKHLTANGEVGPETWSALGTLITADLPQPEPSVVNRERLPQESPEDLSAAPLVTCKAWAIADAASGRLLAGHDEHRPLDIASTTKMMTAYLVLKAAQRDAKVLDEVVTFSRRADATIGTSAALRAGEQAPVREILYGLLLPSGNDAAVALAEHFGSRFAPADTASPPADPMSLFVAEMNRAAKALGMKDTRFMNPHGLTAEGHRSSAADLVLLAIAARRLPRFSEYVGTRQHGYTVRSTAGYRRNVVWKNTNRLLAIEGYSGVKTGTTDAAGACLVACGRRGEKELLVVVLGSASSDARYVDARNLFRWAWRQPGQ